MQRFSKKRQAILDCLRGTTIHPAADWIYEKLKIIYPDLSLATVYRNLAELKKEGFVRSMGIVAGQEHFDADIMPHSHAICRCCGAIVDLKNIQPPQELVETVESAAGYDVSEVVLQFAGLCGKCRR